MTVYNSPGEKSKKTSDKKLSAVLEGLEEKGLDAKSYIQVRIRDPFVVKDVTKL